MFSSVLEYEQKIMDRPLEWGGVFCSVSGAQLAEIGGNSPSEIKTDPDNIPYKDNIFTHNHPGGNHSFSFFDIYNFICLDVKQVRAVSNLGVSIITRDGDFNKKFKQIVEHNIQCINIFGYSYENMEVVLEEFNNQGYIYESKNH